MTTNPTTRPSSRPVARTGSTLLILIRQLLGILIGIVRRAVSFTETWILGKKKARYGLAVTRILIGLVGIGTLVANWNTRLYTWGSGMAWTGELQNASSDFPHVWIFSWFQFVQPSNAAFTASYIGLGVLALLVALGWRTKFVLPVYLCMWVGFIELNGLTSDQGDNIYRMLMIYLLFCDTTSRLSLDARRRARTPEKLRKSVVFGQKFEPFSNLFHNLAIVVVALHVSFIYMSGALYKAQGQTWANGYAIFNPLHVQRFSTWPEIADFITSIGPLAVALSWGTIIVQMMFLPMLMRRPTRIIALLAIFSFHMGIAFFMGLPFFSLAMIAIDAIFIRDVTWRALGGTVRRAWKRAGAASTAPRAEVPAAPAAAPQPALTPAGGN